MVLVKRVRPCGRAALAAPLALLALGACEPSGAPRPVDSGAAPPPAAAAAPVPFDVGPIKSAAEYLAEERYAAADFARGELLSLACAACHTFRSGERHNVGPNLHGVFGRRAASLPDFAYSDALRASGLVWTPVAVEAWLAAPATFVPGTTMAFSGYQNSEDRLDLLAYLLRATR